MIVAVELSTGSWYGHPEQHDVERLYRAASDGAYVRGANVVEEWESPLSCWSLLGDDGMALARAYEPTEKTPRWVFTDSRGNLEIERPISHEQLVALIVIYRMKGGMDVDALHLQA